MVEKLEFKEETKWRKIMKIKRDTIAMFAPFYFQSYLPHCQLQFREIDCNVCDWLFKHFAAGRTILLHVNQSKLLINCLFPMTSRRAHYFVVIAFTATVSVSLTYVIVARTSVNESLCTNVALNLPESQEPEVCIVFIVFYRNQMIK